MGDNKRTIRLRPYIAPKDTNAMMAAFGLCPDYKVFAVREEREEEIELDKRIPAEVFIGKAIESSRQEKDCWIPAIEYGGKLFVAEGIKEISDGQHIIFV